MAAVLDAPVAAHEAAEGRRVEPGAGRVAASLSLKRPITDVAVSSGVVWVALRER